MFKKLLVIGMALTFIACDGEPTRPPGDGAQQNEASVPGPDGGLVDVALGDNGLPPNNDKGVGFDQQIKADSKVPVDPNKDTDGDGLPDGFEALSPNLDPTKKDTDGDKIPDGDEDEDQDGLTAAVEWAAYKATPTASLAKPSPRHRDLLIEADHQTGMLPSAKALSEMVKAYAAINLSNLDGKKGINLMIFVDEKNLPVTAMSESLTARLDYLGAHGPKVLKGAFINKMVHVIFASTRPGSASRGGDTVASNKASAEKAGVLIYPANLAKLFPSCLSPTSPKVTAEEVVISTFVHEVGHTLQLGHDTAAGGGVNPYNIMSTDLKSCDLLKKRTRGEGNTNATLGATPGNAPRFSTAAAKLIKMKNKISVEAKEFEKSGGYEM